MSEAHWSFSVLIGLSVKESYIYLEHCHAAEECIFTVEGGILYGIKYLRIH